MKAKAALITLIVLVLGLGIGLIVTGKRATDDKKEATNKITGLSNNIVLVQAQYDSEHAERVALETNFLATKVEFSNKLAATESTLATTSASLTKAQAEAKAAAEAAAAEIAQRDKKISELENQNQVLDKAALDLRGSITNLETQIISTEKKLATSEGDRQFLLKELKRLQAEKADLEKKFNDLALLRDQIHRLKDEMALSRRLDWIRRGLYANPNQKGGERMIKAAVTPQLVTNNTLNVELKQNGAVNIQSTKPTNAPAAQ